jgi:hypothetical protein
MVVHSSVVPWTVVSVHHEKEVSCACQPVSALAVRQRPDRFCLISARSRRRRHRVVRMDIGHGLSGVWSRVKAVHELSENAYLIYTITHTWRLTLSHVRWHVQSTSFSPSQHSEKRSQPWLPPCSGDRLATGPTQTKAAASVRLFARTHFMPLVNVFFFLVCVIETCFFSCCVFRYDNEPKKMKTSYYEDRIALRLDRILCYMCLCSGVPCYYQKTHGFRTEIRLLRTLATSATLRRV